MALDWLANAMGAAYTPELEKAIEAELGKHFIPRSTFNDLNDNYKKAKDVADKYESLRTTNRKLEQQVGDLEKARSSDKLAHAVALALGDAKVVNRTAVQALLDMTKVTMGEDGQLQGIQDQLEALRKSDPWAFPEAEVKKQKSGLALGGSNTNSAGKAAGTAGGTPKEGADDAKVDGLMNNLLRRNNNAGSDD